MTTPKAKQSLGQNFLSDRNTADHLVELMQFSSKDEVLEIGPGLGVLTERIAPQVRRLVSVEIDQRLYEILQQKMLNVENFELVRQDFLKVELNEFFEQPFRVVGNVPYNITSPIFFKVLEERQRVIDLTMLIQRQVAERVVARPRSKDYGILTVFSQTFAEVTLLRHVPPTVFQPRPNVESSLVRWRFHEKYSKNIKDELFFRTVVKQAFGQRRKMLRKSLKSLLADKPIEWDVTRRPEELSITEWIEFTNILNP